MIYALDFTKVSTGPSGVSLPTPHNGEVIGHLRDHRAYVGYCSRWFADSDGAPCVVYRMHDDDQGSQDFRMETASYRAYRLKRDSAGNAFWADLCEDDAEKMALYLLDLAGRFTQKSRRALK